MFEDSPGKCNVYNSFSDTCVDLSEGFAHAFGHWWCYRYVCNSVTEMERELNADGRGAVEKSMEEVERRLSGGVESALVMVPGISWCRFFAPLALF